MRGVRLVWAYQGVLLLEPGVRKYEESYERKYKMDSLKESQWSGAAAKSK